MVDAGEQCDDGNQNNGDGCDSQCNIEECPDEDHDGVCDPDDMCPDSRPGEPTDDMGCDIFQFCNKQMCGVGCFELDWMNNEPEVKFPKDCTIALRELEGTFEPVCVPTVFSPSCAG